MLDIIRCVYRVSNIFFTIPFATLFIHPLHRFEFLLLVGHDPRDHQRIIRVSLIFFLKYNNPLVL